MSIQVERTFIAFIILVRLAVAVGFSAVGTLEGPDEPGHFAYVRLMATTGGIADPYLVTDPLGQYHQGPLYYWLAGWIGARVGVGTDDQFRAFLHFNDFGDTRLDIIGKDNQNYWLHDQSDQFPYANNPIARAVHAVRLLSVLLGGLTVLAAYMAFLQIWPPADGTDNKFSQAMRLMAIGLIAFWPQLIFLSSVINNDNLLLFLSTLSIYLVLRQLRTGWTASGSFALGLVLGLALLTKVNGLLLAFPVGAAALVPFISVHQKKTEWRSALHYPALILSITLIVAGWWYVRNAVLYGDPFNFRAMYESWGGRTIPGSATTVALGYAISSLPDVYETFWARFGYTGMLEVGNGITIFFGLLSIFGLGGLLIHVIRTRVDHKPLFSSSLARMQTLVFATWLVALVIGLEYYSGREVQGDQARYLFPGLVAIGAAIVVGLCTLLPRKLLHPVAFSLIAVMGFISSDCLLEYYWPAFRPSPLPPVIDQPLAYQFGNPAAAELIGMSPAALRAYPGELIHITLYWRALRTVDKDLVVYIHSAGNPIVDRNSYPGGGTLLSSNWKPGESWSETYSILIPENAQTQVVYPLVAGLLDHSTNIALPTYKPNGALTDPVIGQLAINKRVDTLPTAYYRFGSTIGLTQPILSVKGDALNICLDWLSLGAQSHNEQVFIHLFDSHTKLIAQLGNAPLSGQYPTTYWADKESINDCEQLPVSQLSQGMYVTIGMYDAVSNQRLQAYDSAGHMLTNNEIVLPVSVPIASIPMSLPLPAVF